MSSGERIRTPTRGTKNRCPTIRRPRTGHGSTPHRRFVRPFTVSRVAGLDTADSVARLMGSLIKKRRKRMRKKKHKKMLRRTRHQRRK